MFYHQLQQFLWPFLFLDFSYFSSTQQSQEHKIQVKIVLCINKTKKILIKKSSNTNWPPCSGWYPSPPPGSSSGGWQNDTVSIVVVKEQGGNGHMAGLQTLNNFTKVTLQISEDMKYLKILSMETNRTVNKIYLHITRFMVCIHVRRQVVTAMGSWAFAPWLLVCKQGVSKGVVKVTGMGDTPLGVFPMPHVCGLSFAVLDALWLLVCKWGVSEGGDDSTASWGTHLFGVFPIPQHLCHICGMGGHGCCCLSFAVLGAPWFLVCKWGVSEKTAMGIWAHSQLGVCPIPQCPCHIHGMGTVTTFFFCHVLCSLVLITFS